MTVHDLSAHIAPLAHAHVAVASLVVLFLIVEIPLVFSIFKNSSKDEDSKTTDQ